MIIMAWLRERRLVGLPTSTAAGTFVTDQSDVGKAIHGFTQEMTNRL